MAKISPSAISTFKQCPLKFRLRYIDLIIEEAPSIEAARGTVVHYILEKMFKQPAEKREINRPQDTTINAIKELQVTKDWTGQMKLNYPFKDAAEKETFTKDVVAALKVYFKNEDPKQIKVKATEQFLRLKLADNLNLNGFADRLDESENGVRVVDYKTGKKPSERFKESVIFQMNTYALILYSNTKNLPAAIKAIYLSPVANGVIEEVPSVADVLGTEKIYLETWSEINNRISDNEWPANKGPLCNWCDLQQFCPQFGGKTPELTSEKIDNYLK